MKYVISWSIGEDLRQTETYGVLFKSYREFGSLRQCEQLEAKLEHAAETIGISHLLTTEIEEEDGNKS